MVEVPAMVGGSLGRRAGMSQVGETPYVSVIGDYSFCPTTHRNGPRSWAFVVVVTAGARAARGRRTSSSIVRKRSLWCRSTKSDGHRSHICTADSTSSPHIRQMASSGISINCCQRRRAG